MSVHIAEDRPIYRAKYSNTNSPENTFTGEARNCLARASCRLLKSIQAIYNQNGQMEFMLGIRRSWLGIQVSWYIHHINRQGCWMFLVDVTGVRITVEIHFQACLWACFQEGLMEERRPTWWKRGWQQPVGRGYWIKKKVNSSITFISRLPGCLQCDQRPRNSVNRSMHAN